MNDQEEQSDDPVTRLPDSLLERIRGLQREGELGVAVIERGVGLIERAEQNERDRDQFWADVRAQESCPSPDATEPWPDVERVRPERGRGQAHPPLTSLYFSTKYMRRHPRRLLNRVERENVVAVITRGGRPALVVVPYWYFQSLSAYSLCAHDSRVEERA